MKPIIPKTNIRSNVKSNAKINVKSKPLKKSSRLNELRQTFRRTAKKELFGEVSYYERLFTLYRLSNKPPNEKIMDLAKRILDVYNGKGTRLDVLNFKKLIREFEKESNIKINDLFSFLRNSKAPKTFGEYNREIARLDRHVLQYAEVFKWFDSMIEGIKLKDNKIIKGPTKINFKNRELTKRFLELINRENVRAREWLRNNYRIGDGIINADVIHGAVVLFLDGNKPLPPELSNRLNGLRGGVYIHSAPNTPERIIINMNSFPNNAHMLAILKHELRHNLQRRFKDLMVRDRHMEVIDVYGIIPPKYPAYAKRNYEILFGREITPKNMRDMERQRGFLDELHSNFVGLDRSWFKTGSHTAYNNVDNFFARHHELVGNNPKDINATKDLFCHLQGFYVLNKRVNSIDPRLRRKILDYFNKAGIILGTSITVQQASRLISQVWNEVLKTIPGNKHVKIMEAIFEEFPLYERGVSSDGQALEYFLLYRDLK